MVRAVLGVVVLLGPGCKLESSAIAPQDGAPTPDAPVAGDAAPDAPIDGIADVGCSGVDADVVMYLTMNQPTVTIWPDLVADHDGRTSPGTTGGVDGPNAECGRAYDARDNVRLVIADSPEFDLDTGSVDVFALVPTAGAEAGIVSRDADAQALPGHFEIGFSTTNQVVVRIQDDTTEAYRCSAAQTTGTWVHIGVNFGAGGLELFVDGVLAGEASAVYAGATQTCGAAFTGGIAGNNNPWVVGHSSLDSGEGSATPTTRPLDTAIDELRLSRVRRTY